ncbi:MAG TPA: zinc-dependent metalloprotease, partial [Acidimicrobiales bacterium]|nr:zinc-dependent metalloprotease [Acidimicrobiales bacterium]
MTTPAGEVADPVNWVLAARVADRVAGTEPLASSYLYDSLADDFAEATARAEELVAEETGLRSLAGPARARVTDRQGWVAANVASFRRLLSPLTARMAERPLSPPLAAVARHAAGAQVGTLLGWMSTRVLGQYDLLLVED